MNTRSPEVPASYTTTTFGCDTFAVACASRMRRLRFSAASPERSARTNLMAILRSSSGSYAAYTSPIAPRPTQPRTTNLPSAAPLPSAGPSTASACTTPASSADSFTRLNCWRAEEGFADRSERGRGGPKRAQRATSPDLVVSGDFQQAALDGRGVLGHETRVDVADDARPIDHVRGRHLLGLQALGDETVWVVRHRERPAAVAAQELVDVGALLVDRDRQDLDALALEPARHRVQHGELLLTGRAPRSPHVEQQHPALIRRDVDLLARQRVHFHLGQRRAHPVRLAAGSGSRTGPRAARRRARREQRRRGAVGAILLHPRLHRLRRHILTELRDVEADLLGRLLDLGRRQLVLLVPQLVLELPELPLLLRRDRGLGGEPRVGVLGQRVMLEVKLHVRAVLVDDLAQNRLESPAVRALVVGELDKRNLRGRAALHGRIGDVDLARRHRPVALDQRLRHLGVREPLVDQPQDVAERGERFAAAV